MSADGATPIARPERRKYDHDAILDRWAAGETSFAIGKLTGMRPEAVRGVVLNGRRRGDPRAVPHEQETGAARPRLADDGSSGWTQARMDHAKSLYDDGASFSQIAAAIGGGITRNAVIGMAHRQGWSGRKPPGTSLRTQQRAKRASDADRSLMNKLRRKSAPPPPKPKPARILPPRIEDMVQPVSRDVALLDLRARDCRWPSGDGPFRFCGHRAEEGRSYCGYHTRLAYQPITTRQERQDSRAVRLA